MTSRGSSSRARRPGGHRSRCPGWVWRGSPVRRGAAANRKASAGHTRVTMVGSWWKAEAPICTCDFTAGPDLSQSNLSQHMSKLKEAGLVESEKRGIWMYYRLASDLDSNTRRLL